MKSDDLLDYSDAVAWVKDCPKLRGTGNHPPSLLLGNGFSIAYSAATFTYNALRKRAEEDGLIGETASAFFNSLNTEDFELVIKSMSDAKRALEILDSAAFASVIALLETETANLKDALAQVLAGLHPERPMDIEDAAYVRVRQFLDQFAKIYTANYDLLLYWALMQETDGVRPRWSDDGFRSPASDTPYVTWDYLDPHQQNVHYLHGALHLYRGEGELQKLTWVRTQSPLIEQIREQLRSDRFPLFVAEGSSAEKLDRIQHSDYLSKALRSLAQISGGVLAYGLSFSENDEHIIRAVLESKVSKLAVSVYGDPENDLNRSMIANVLHLSERRFALDTRHPLEVQFFASASVPLWS